jgi:DsbC/DsbD-like thiol-disulfide interchange protein
MKNFIFPAILFFSLCFIAALPTQAQTVTGSLGNGTVVRGKAARGTIQMTIPGGLHVNSNRPSSEYAIPTVVTLSVTGARAGNVIYPKGKNRKFQFSENPINVYEGRVRFPFTVMVPAKGRGNVVRVRATVRYQACTDEVCYPPRTKTVTVTARVS